MVVVVIHILYIQSISMNVHHHHDKDLLQKLERCGFGDAVRFTARYDPDRVKAAIAYVESLAGVRNRGALIRLTVERPGEIPKPYRPYHESLLSRRANGNVLRR